MTRKHFLLISVLMLIIFSFPALAQVAEKAIELDNKSQEIHGEDDVFQQLEYFSTSLSYVLRNYYKDLSKEELENVMNGAIRGMLQGLGDRYSFYQSESSRKREQENLFYAKFGGLGIRILPSPDGFVNIVQPMDGTPAMKVGLRSGDKIIKVNDESIENKSMEDVVDILRGEVGTEVTITILRPGKDMPFDVTITRGIIKFPSVRNVMIDDQIGYISISSFTAETAKELKEAIDKLKEQNVKALTVDLRNNTGGMMSSAVAVSNAFLDGAGQYGGLIVSTDGKLDRFDSEYRAEKDKIMVPMDMPMALLVNGNSASGSEIVAGAIKDYKRGVIVGKKTFGKGVVQQRFPLDEYRAVSITVSIYKTPSGEWIHGKGVEPDIEVEQPKLLEGEDDAMLAKLYEGEYVDKFVYGYLEEHQDQDPDEQLKALESKIPELMKTLEDNEIKLSEKILRLYVQRTFSSTKYIPSIDLENDLQLATAVNEIKKKMNQSN